MIELRWIKSEKIELNTAYASGSMKLQYRVYQENFYTKMNLRGECENVTFHEWSDWKDVPTVQDGKND